MKTLGLLIIMIFSGVTNTSFFHSQLHDIHVCTTEMEWNEKGVEISVRIFSDDLLNALVKRFGLKEIPETQEKTHALIEAYITEEMIISQKNQQVALHLVDVESWQDAFLCVFNIAPADIDPLLIFKVQNEILFELFDDQTNIMQIFRMGEKKVVTFDRKNNLEEIRF